MEVGHVPREQITHNRIVDQLVSSPTYASNDPAAQLEAIAHVEMPRRNVHVGWNREVGWVQVAIEVTVAELRDMLAAAETEAAGAARANADIGEYAVDAHQFKVWSDVLDRPEINSTVQVLRRARDAAYGKDA